MHTHVEAKIVASHDEEVVPGMMGKTPGGCGEAQLLARALRLEGPDHRDSVETHADHRRIGGVHSDAGNCAAVKPAAGHLAALAARPACASSRVGAAGPMLRIISAAHHLKMADCKICGWVGVCMTST